MKTDQFVVQYHTDVGNIITNSFSVQEEAEQFYDDMWDRRDTLHQLTLTWVDLGARVLTVLQKWNPEPTTRFRASYAVDMTA